MTGPFDALPEFPPHRVHALVVGVETYDTGPDWDLPGAGRDAARIADWLTRCAGLPAANVRLLLSAPAGRHAPAAGAYPAGAPFPVGGAHPAGAPNPADGALPVEAATEANVLRVLFRELPARDGDLLWIYWAGHGFLDGTDRLMLPYTDATEQRTSHLNLGSALRWWRSGSAPPGRFRHQVAIADACRIDERPLSAYTFGTTEYGGATTDPDRHQFVLYASRAAEQARNDAERGAGRFTESLLGKFAGRGLGEVVHGLPGIARAVQADFALSRAAGAGGQHPEFLVDRGWDGSPVLGDRWTAPRPSAEAARLDQQAWNGLGALLAGRRLPDHTYDAYRWAFEVGGCAAPPSRALPSTQLLDIVRDLDQRHGNPARPHLVPAFLRHLAAWSDDRPWARRADSWIDGTVTRTRTPAVPPAPPRPTEGPELHVKLTEDSLAGDRYWVRMWFHEAAAGFRSLWESDRPLPLAEVRDHLTEQLRSLLASPGRTGAPLGRIEFDVPYPLLGEAFESWRLPLGRPGRPARELGDHYEVVLRCPDERVGTSAESWRQKWRWFKVHGGEQSAAVHRVRDQDVCEELGLLLQKESSPVAVLAEVSEPYVDGTLEAVLDAGVPIAVWPRPAARPATTGPATDTTGPATTGAATGSGATDTGTSLACRDVRELPLTVRRRRRWPDGRPLALLWDDPDRIPEQRFAGVTPRADERTSER
ncbi:hypothetical protein [Kitasatospora sp. NPDC048538]|uniref:VMAP-C domain-containing protein n=1 Tax=unclassified Kitasatospora TaxID=2633591 RepID=UPI0033C09B3E